MSISHETSEAIRRHLRILGYSYPSVEWDGAMAAARAYAERSCDGEAFPVTIRREDAQRLFDLAVDSPLVCSGSFETDDVVVLRRLAALIGVDPAIATPSEFLRDFPHPFKAFAVDIERNEVVDTTSPTIHVFGVMCHEGTRMETDDEVYARLGEGPDRCSAGSYSRRCTRPAADPIHQTSGGTPAAEMGA